MKLAIIGDIHGDIHGMYKYILEWQMRTDTKLDGIVHVGDFGCYLPEGAEFISRFSNEDFKDYWDGRRKIPIPTWVVPGNHEDYTVLTLWSKQPDKVPNLHLLPDGEVTAVLGMKVGAIWGNFSYKSWMNPDRVRIARLNACAQNQKTKKALHIYRPAVEKLLTAGKFDMLITHDAPAGMMPVMGQPSDDIKSVLGLEHDEPASGCPGFNELHMSGRPTYHFFGHFHTYKVCKYECPTVICLHCFNYNPAQSISVVEF